MKKWSYFELVGVLRVGDLMTPRLAYARCPPRGRMQWTGKAGCAVE